MHECADVFFLPRSLQMRGYDITTHVLACFGGAG